MTIQNVWNFYLNLIMHGNDIETFFDRSYKRIFEECFEIELLSSGIKKNCREAETEREREIKQSTKIIFEMLHFIKLMEF